MSAAADRIDTATALRSGLPLGRRGGVFAPSIEAAQVVGGIVRTLWPAFASYAAAREGARLGKLYKERQAIMESNRMMRTAEAKEMSKKDLVLAYVEQGHKRDQAESRVAELTAQNTEARRQLQVNIDELSKRDRALSRLARAQDEIRKLRALVAHYFDAPGES